jgi:hypothetical protein
MAFRNLIDSIPIHLTYTLEPDEKTLLVPVLENADAVKKPFTFNYWSEAVVDKVFYNAKTHTIRFVFDENFPPEGGEVLSIVGWFYIPFSSETTSNS